MRIGRAALTASVATGATAGVTVANRLGELSVSTLAASPQTIGDGKVWLVASSGVLADRPAIPSLVGFWVVAVAVLLVCSVRDVAGIAIAGHTLSALGVYGAIGLARLADPHAFASVVHVADYGLSAIIAAWLGAIARVFWGRHRTPAHRSLIALGSIACAGIGLTFRPDLTFLDSEHLLAYAIGVILADPTINRRLALPARRLVAAATGLLLTAGGFPTAPAGRALRLRSR
jgi:hypothetical protein